MAENRKIKHIYAATHPFFSEEEGLADKMLVETLLHQYKALVDRVASDEESILYIEYGSAKYTENKEIQKKLQELNDYAEKRLGDRLWEINKLRDYRIGRRKDNFAKEVNLFSAGERYGLCPITTTGEIMRAFDKKGVKVNPHQMPDIGSVPERSILGISRGKDKSLSEIKQRGIQLRRARGIASQTVEISSALGMLKHRREAVKRMPVTEGDLEEITRKRGFSVINPFKRRKRKK